MDNENKYNIQDLDEYIRQGEPERREKAIAWQTAIGLQAVDGLTPSQYLLETARKNIEGEITTDMVRQLVDSYYQNKTARTAADQKRSYRPIRLPLPSTDLFLFTVAYLTASSFMPGSCANMTSARRNGCCVVTRCII